MESKWHEPVEENMPENGEATEGYEENEIIEFLIENARPGASGPIRVVAHDPQGKVVIFDRKTQLSFELKAGQRVKARISKVFAKYYVAIPLALIQSEQEIQKPTFLDVLKLIDQLSDEEKYRLLELLGLPQDLTVLKNALKKKL